MKKFRYLLIGFLLINLMLGFIPSDVNISYDKVKSKTINSVGATNLYVDWDQVPGWYDATHVATVQEAVTNSSGGNTVYIYAGEYIESSISINKQLHFIGNGTSQTILNTTNDWSDFMTFQSGANGSIVEYVQFYDNVDDGEGAIQLTGGEDYTIRNCYFYQCDNAIDSSTQTVSNIYIHNNVIDSDLADSGGITLGSNKENVFIHNNTIWGNCTTGLSGQINLGGDSDNISIVDNYISSTFGSIDVAPLMSENVTISRNTLIERNDLYNWNNILNMGIYVGRFTDATIENNVVSQVIETTVTRGIFVGFAGTSNTNILVRNNNISNYAISLYINAIAYGTFDNNICQGGTGGNACHGINLITDGAAAPYADSLYINVRNNTINNKGGDGIYVEFDSHNITICNNRITNITNQGLDTDGGLINSTFHSNEIYNTTSISIYLRGAKTTLNRIYNNNITSSGTLGSDTAGGTNWWNLTSITLGHNIVDGFNLGGNYWSNYTGIDANGDSIGDTPYTYGGVDDNFPLVTGNYQTVPDPPYNGNADYYNGVQALNLTWSRGNASNREVIIRNSNNFPTTPYDGTEIYNNTNLYYNASGIDQYYYYTAFSYNHSYNSFSTTGLDFNWGLLSTRVYNESTPSQSIVFDIFITNEEGTQTYEDTSCSNTHFIPIQEIPYGDDTVIIISAPYYKQRVYYQDIVLNAFYNYSFYLPPLYTDEEEGGGDEGGNTTTSQLYVLTVVGPQGDYTSAPLEDVLMEIKWYNNETDNYEIVTSVYTDANGRAYVWLVPHTLYKLFLSKENYVSKISDFIPSNILFEYTFRLEPDVPDVPIYDDFWGDISFTTSMVDAGCGNPGNLTVTYLDDNSSTVNTTILVYQFYNGTWTLNTTDSRSSSSSFSFTVIGINTSRTYVSYLYMNTTANYNVSMPIKSTCYPINIWPCPNRTAILEDRITNVFGSFELGWTNTISVILALIVLVSVGVYNVGAGIMGAGLALGLTHSIFVINFGATIDVGMIALIPVCIFIGIIYFWTKGTGVEQL